MSTLVQLAAHRLSCRPSARLRIAGNHKLVARSQSMTGAAHTCAWQPLGTPRTELNLHCTLPTGQTFRWKKTGIEEYTGVVASLVARFAGNLLCCNRLSAVPVQLLQLSPASWYPVPCACVAGHMWHSHNITETIWRVQVQLRHTEHDVEWRIVGRSRNANPGAPFKLHILYSFVLIPNARALRKSEHLQHAAWCQQLRCVAVSNRGPGHPASCHSSFVRSTSGRT